MAEQIRLVRANESAYNDTSPLDLFSLSSGISLEWDTWSPAYGGRELVDEEFTLVVQGSSRDDLAAKLQTLETWLSYIEQFTQSVSQKHYIVLRDQADGETNYRQSPIARCFVQPMRINHQHDYVARIPIVLTRVPWWEGRLSYDISFLYVSTIGGKSSFTSAAGTLPGRIWETLILGHSGTINELWAGFRTTRFGDYSKFVSPWEVENTGVTLGTDASKTTDSTASPGGTGNTKIRISFATQAGLVNRFYLRAADVVAVPYYDVSEIRGTYDIVARMKVSSSGTVCTVRLDNGHYDHNNSVWSVAEYGQNIQVSSTNWKFVNLGRITWPPLGRNLYTKPTMFSAAVCLAAARTAGSGALDVDCFVPIPVEEGSLYISSCIASQSIYTNININPFGHVTGFIATVSNVAIRGYPALGGISLDTWYFPNGGDGGLIVAANTDSPALTDQVGITCSFYPRWKTLRGSA